MDWLGKELGYTKMEDWYKINAKVIIDNYGCGLIHCYGGSPIKLITKI